MSRVRKARLPNDIAGLLDDRIADDSRDFAAYNELIAHFRSKGKTDEARNVYEQLVKVLPASAHVWRQYAEMEASENELNRVEKLFNRALMSSLHLDIWNYYLDYIRRTHPLSTGGSSARSVISQAYEFVLQHVGIDLESGPVWADYLTFLKSAPASSTWEEQQRNDQLRKAYQRAVVTPLNNVEFLWREYNSFENGINKQTARKFLNEKSPAYMTARAMAKEIGAILRALRSHKLPIRGGSGPVEVQYLAGWRKWLSLEKSDPLDLEDQTQLRNRIKYAYKQCLMYCRFFPQMWYDAAAYYDSLSELESVQDATQTKPSATLKEGLNANPTSWLLSFAYAEVEEAAQRNENVKATFDTLIAANEAQITQLQTEYEEKIEQAKTQDSTSEAQAEGDGSATESDDDSDSESNDPSSTENGVQAPPKKVAIAVKKLQDELEEKITELSQEGTIAAIMYMRALRRMEGIKAARLSFASSIRSPHMSWQIYVASALMEHQYDDSKPSDKDGKTSVPIPVRIFTRGLKLFPENVNYILEYLNFLLSIRDDKNARALFEQTTAKLDPVKARPLFRRWYEYESMYGDLTSAQKLATRIAELDDASNALSLFGQRFSYLGCDPIARRDLGKKSSQQQLAPPMLPPPLPLPFPPPIPGQPGSIPAGFNPPILPQYQRLASPAAPATIIPPPPPPLHPTLVNLLRVLPPANVFDGQITFNHNEFMTLLSSIEIPSIRHQSLPRSSPAPSVSRQATPQVVAAPPTVVPAKRSAQSMLPTPDDVIALGRHNDPRDPYRKKV